MSKTHTIRAPKQSEVAQAALQVTGQPKGDAAILPPALDTEKDGAMAKLAASLNDPKATKGRKESRSTTGQTVGKPNLSAVDMTKVRDEREAHRIADGIIAEAKAESARWTRHFVAILDATVEQRKMIVTFLDDAKKAAYAAIGADKKRLSKAAKIGKQVTNASYVRISELQRFCEACNKGLTRENMPKVYEKNGHGVTAETATREDFVIAARTVLGKKGSRSSGQASKPLAERADPETQLRAAILYAVGAEIINPGILTDRWIKNHAVEVLTKMVHEKMVAPRMDIEDAAKAARKVIRGTDDEAKGGMSAEDQKRVQNALAGKKAA